MGLEKTAALLDVSAERIRFLGSEVNPRFPPFRQLGTGERASDGNQARHGVPIFGQGRRFAAVVDPADEIVKTSGRLGYV